MFSKVTVEKLKCYFVNNHIITFFEGFQYGVWHMLCISP